MQKKLNDTNDNIPDPTPDDFHLATTDSRETALAVSHQPESSMPSLGVIEGELSMRDIELPYIQIIHGVGKNSLKYAEGSIVLSKQVIGKPPKNPGEFSEPIIFTVLNAKKVFKRKRLAHEWGEDYDRSKEILLTLEDVKSVGGTTDGTLATPTRPLYYNELQLTALIRATNDEMFQRFSIDGPNAQKYAMAMMYLSGPAWGAAKTIITAYKVSLAKKGLCSWEFSLKIRKEEYGKGTCYLSHCSLSSPHDEATLEWLKTMVQ
jgi:hypothetical protein